MSASREQEPASKEDERRYRPVFLDAPPFDTIFDRSRSRSPSRPRPLPAYRPNSFDAVWEAHEKAKEERAWRDFGRDRHDRFPTSGDRPSYPPTLRHYPSREQVPPPPVMPWTAMRQGSFSRARHHEQQEGRTHIDTWRLWEDAMEKGRFRSESDAEKYVTERLAQEQQSIEAKVHDKYRRQQEDIEQQWDALREAQAAQRRDEETRRLACDEAERTTKDWEEQTRSWQAKIAKHENEAARLQSRVDELDAEQQPLRNQIRDDKRSIAELEEKQRDLHHRNERLEGDLRTMVNELARPTSPTSPPPATPRNVSVATSQASPLLPSTPRTPVTYSCYKCEERERRRRGRAEAGEEEAEDDEEWQAVETRFSDQMQRMIIQFKRQWEYIERFHRRLTTFHGELEAHRSEMAPNSAPLPAVPPLPRDNEGRWADGSDGDEREEIRSEDEDEESDQDDNEDAGEGAKVDTNVANSKDKTNPSAGQTRTSRV